MKVKEIIQNSDVIIGNDEAGVQDNCVPCNGRDDFDFFGNQPCFVFADKFIEKFGDCDAVRISMGPDDQDVPEEIYGRQDDYDWYQIGGGARSDNATIFGVY